MTKFSDEYFYRPFFSSGLSLVHNTLLEQCSSILYGDNHHKHTYFSSVFLCGIKSNQCAEMVFKSATTSAQHEESYRTD